MTRPKNLTDLFQQVERQIAPPEPEPEDDDEGYDSPPSALDWGDDVRDAVQAGRAIGEMVAPVAWFVLRVFF